MDEVVEFGGDFGADGGGGEDAWRGGCCGGGHFVYLGCLVWLVCWVGGVI